MKTNTGISLLRIWMCFEVITSHFFYDDRIWGGSLYPLALFIDRFRYVHVGIFMVLAFYFTDMSAAWKGGTRAKKRFARLLVPYLFWAVVYFVIFWIGDRIKKGEPYEHGFTDLVWQILFGHSINETLWFHWDLLAITFLFFLMLRLLKKETAVWAAVLLGAGCVVLQYTGVHAHLFDSVTWPPTVLGGYFRPSYVTVPLGRFFEMLPYAAAGVLLYHIRIFEKIQKISVIACLLGGAGAYLLAFVVPIARPEGYGYQGLWAFALALCTIVFAYFLPMDLFAEKVTGRINAIAPYTMGVYFAHRLIDVFLDKFRIYALLRTGAGTLAQSALLFLVTYLCVWLLAKAPVRIVRDSCR